MKTILLSLIALGITTCALAEDRSPIRFVEPKKAAVEKKIPEVVDETVSLDSLAKRIKQLERQMGRPKDTLRNLENRVERIEQVLKKLERDLVQLQHQVRLKR